MYGRHESMQGHKPHAPPPYLQKIFAREIFDGEF
jgi:hypothetical protein